MQAPSLELATQLDPKLAAYIDEVVGAKVSQQCDMLREQLAQELKEDHQTAALPCRRATIVAFSGDMDKLMAALIIATGAATMGMEVSIYFTFWALTALKKKTRLKGKPLLDRLMALMLPSGPGHLSTSKMNMLGLGPAFFGRVMRKKKMSSVNELIRLARETGVRFIACQTAMEVMGIGPDELLDDLDFGGVATYLADARESGITLFI
jgi:peroxiredoxin family protein